MGYDSSREVYLVDGKFFDRTKGIVVDAKMGLLSSTLVDFNTRGQKTEIFQFLTIVADGLVMTSHIFEGLKRGLHADGSQDGALLKLVCTWKCKYDIDWTGDQHYLGFSQVHPPANHAYMVIMTPNIRHREQYPDVACWINKWNWVEEDAGLAGAPKGWIERFDRKLWSKDQ